MTTRILLDNLRIYAFHGVLQQERKVGAYFILNLRLAYDFTHAMETDNLQHTISYADVYNIVIGEMQIPSNLVEHVAGRIIDHLCRAYPTLTEINLSILKENPPMGADCRGAGIEINYKA